MTKLLTVALAVNTVLAGVLAGALLTGQSCKVESRIVQLPPPTPEEWKAREYALARGSQILRDDLAWAVVRGIDMYRRGQIVRPLDK